VEPFPGEVEDRWVSAPGGQLFTRTWRPERVFNLPPVILLHDSLGSVELWRDFPARLARSLGQPVIAYDRLGFGKSGARVERPSDAFIEEEATIYFPCLKNQLELEKYILFGHSIGGTMALTIAAADPDCRAVVSESGIVFMEDRTMEGLLLAKEQFSDPNQRARLARWHGDKADWILDAWLGLWTSPNFADWSLAPTLPAVKCPVLAIHGDRDDFGSVAFPETICRHVSGPCEMILLADRGHTPHREHPGELLHFVTQFVIQSGE